MYIACDKSGCVVAISETPFSSLTLTVHKVGDLPRADWPKLVGRRLISHKPTRDLRVAFLCNWNDLCGISTYSRFLVEAVKPKVKEVHVFSEAVPEQTAPDEPYVSRVWRRGRSMKDATQRVLDWNPDILFIQHEFGIFPKATYFLQMLQMLEGTRYAVTLHSVYEHLDKSVCTSAIRNIVVHTESGKAVLRKLGNSSRVFVVPHGCLSLPDTGELWNIFQTPYALVQFGFGFFYKGVDVAIDAVHRLKSTDPKFQDIFYCYLCSDNAHTSSVHDAYYDFLSAKIDGLGLRDNVAIIRKFQTEQTINYYLRTAKVALFPYVMDPNNTVYGASGAIRVAMANRTPVIASNSHQFDDLEGIVPRPGGAPELAAEIDKIFSSEAYRKECVEKNLQYIAANSWDVTADRYLALYNEL